MVFVTIPTMIKLRLTSSSALKNVTNPDMNILFVDGSVCNRRLVQVLTCGLFIEGFVLSGREMTGDASSAYFWDF